jgi:hypothetical protein
VVPGRSPRRLATAIVPACPQHRGRAQATINPPPGPTDVLCDRRPPQTEAVSDRASTEPVVPLEPQSGVDVMQGAPLCRPLLLPHQVSNAHDTERVSPASYGVPFSRQRGGSCAVDSGAGFTWTRWQLCRGIRTPISSLRVCSTSVQRHYERLSTFLEGFVVLGDAISSFNPIYGQGMISAWL